MIKNQKWALPILMSLVVLPRLSVDLYLPSLPQMGLALHASNIELQMTLTTFMFGYGASMLISGPLSDTLGKSRVLIFGLGLFILATLVCALTNDLGILTMARFFQALGGCCGTVIARVSVRDTYAKEMQIKILAQLSSIMAICPLIAPILGGFFQSYHGWQSSFFVLIIFGSLLLTTCIMQTQDNTQNKCPDIREFLSWYKILLTSRLFLGYSLAIGFAWSAYFTFTLISPFVFQNELGLSPVMFGLTLSFITLGYLFGIRLTKMFANKIGWDKLIMIGACVCLGGSLLLILLLSVVSLCWQIITLPMMFIMSGVGIIIPCTQAAVLQPFQSIAGTAAGLFFFIQMLFGALCGVIVQFLESSPLLMAVMILIISLCLVVSFYSLIVHKELAQGYDASI